MLVVYFKIYGLIVVKGNQDKMRYFIELFFVFGSFWWMDKFWNVFRNCYGGGNVGNRDQGLGYVYFVQYV